MPHTQEHHAIHRVGWLRAGVLGANDGIVSTAALIIGVAAASATKAPVLIAGLAGLVAGAMSMAAGEYVSVSSQADAEAADLAMERAELEAHPEHELRELAAIYRARGLSRDLAMEVATALTAHDALGAHARDELGLSDDRRARPTQAALTSAATFAVGAGLPLLVAWAIPSAHLIAGVAVTALLSLMLLGAVGARTGGAPVARGMARVAVWGMLAMAATFAIGRLFGTTIA